MHLLIIPGVTTPSVDESLLTRIQETAGAEFASPLPRNAGEAANAMEDVEVFLGTIPPEMSARAKGLCSLHAITSGTDSYLFPEMVRSEVRLTGDKGLVGSHLSDYTFALLLWLTRRLAAAVKDAPNSWANRVAYQAEEFEFEGCTMGTSASVEPGARSSDGRRHSACAALPWTAIRCRAPRKCRRCGATIGWTSCFELPTLSPADSRSRREHATCSTRVHSVS